MKNQTEIKIIKQNIEDNNKSIKECKGNIDRFEEKKRSDMRNANDYDKEISFQRDQIKRMQKENDDLIKQLSM